MKKTSLFLISSLFSIGAMAQTSPTAAPKPADTKVIPASNSSVTGTGSKAIKVTSSTSSGVAKNNLKKTGSNKKAIHHVTPVKKSDAPGTAKDASNQDSNPKK